MSISWESMSIVARIAYALAHGRRDRLNKINGKTLTEYELGTLVDDVILEMDYVPNPKHAQVPRGITWLDEGTPIPQRSIAGAFEHFRNECAKQLQVDSTLAARGSRYGKFNGVAQITQALKAEMRVTPNWDSLSFDKREALEMIAQKIARILNGDPNYHDSWHDIAGYAELVASALQGVQK